MKYLSMILLGLAVTSAAANDTLNIDVDVSSDAAACTPALSNGGKADFGNRSAGSLSEKAFTQLGTRELVLTITCESSTAVAIAARDTRATSVVVGADKNGGVGPLMSVNGSHYVGYATQLFGLGFTDEKKPIGSYAVEINAAGVTAQDRNQTVSVDIAGSVRKNGPWSKVEQPSLWKSESYFYTFVKKGTVTPQPISSASVPLQISASVASQLGSSQSITLDGEAVISIIYL